MDEIFQSAGSPLKLFAQRLIERGLSELPKRVAATGRALRDFSFLPLGSHSSFPGAACSQSFGGEPNALQISVVSFAQNVGVLQRFWSFSGSKTRDGPLQSEKSQEKIFCNSLKKGIWLPGEDSNLQHFG